MKPKRREPRNAWWNGLSRRAINACNRSEFNMFDSTREQFVEWVRSNGNALKKLRNIGKKTVDEIQKFCGVTIEPIHGNWQCCPECGHKFNQQLNPNLARLRKELRDESKKKSDEVLKQHMRGQAIFDKWMAEHRAERAKRHAD